MRKIIFLILNLFLVTNTYSQTEVVRESEKCTDCLTKEQVTEINEIYSELLNLREKIPTINGQTNGTLEQLKERIEYNKKALFYIQRNQLLEKCRQIRQKGGEKIGKTCNIQKYEVDRINGVNNKINARIIELQNLNKTTKGEEEGKKIAHSIKMSELDRELEELDKQLKNESRKSSKKKTKSLDDFLATYDIKQNENSEDFLADLSASNKKQNKNSDDFLADITNSNKKSNNNDFLDGIDEKKEGKSFEIKYKDGKQGVVDKYGNVLIPFKNWSIEEFKLGIAKVEERYSTKEICDYVTGTYVEDGKRKEIKMHYYVNVYKIGFVDSTGNYIDKFDFDYRQGNSESGRSKRLYLTVAPCQNYSAYDVEGRNKCMREYYRKKEQQERLNEIRERKNQIKARKCQIKSDEYVKSKKS